MKELKGKTLIRLDVDSEIQMIKDELGGGTAYQTKQVGSILVASAIKQENASAFDPISGEVALGEFKGLTAYFHKLCYREAQRYGNQNHLFDGKDIDMPDGKYLQIDNDSIFFYTERWATKIHGKSIASSTVEQKRLLEKEKCPDGYEESSKIHMTPAWTLCEPITDWAFEYVDGVRVKSRISTGGILIPVTNEEYKTEKAILRHIHPKVSEELQLFAGDIVFLDKACDLPVEDELNMKLDKKYFRVEVQNILGVEPDSNNDKLNERWNELQPFIDKEFERATNWIRK